MTRPFCNRAATAILAIALSACTTLRPVAGTPAELQRGLAAGTLLKKGDHVLIQTKDGRSHEFKVTRLTGDRVEGKGESVSFDTIEWIDKRRVSGGRIAAIVGVTIGAVITVGILVVLHELHPTYSGN